MILAWNHCWFTLFTWCVSQLFWMVSCDIDLWLGMGAFIVVKTWTLSEWNSKSAVFCFSRSFSHLFQGIGTKQRRGENVRQICSFWCRPGLSFSQQRRCLWRGGGTKNVNGMLLWWGFHGPSLGCITFRIVDCGGVGTCGVVDVLEGSQCNDMCIRWHFKELR